MTEERNDRNTVEEYANEIRAAYNNTTLTREDSTEAMLAIWLRADRQFRDSTGAQGGGLVDLHKKVSGILVEALTQTENIVYPAGTRVIRFPPLDQ